MEKINIAELLRDCPKGMELYSPIYGNGILTKVTDRIHVKFPKEHNVKCFRPDGRVSEDGEIMIFPKGKTTWEGFHRPYINGDIVYTICDSIAILGDRIGEHSVGFRSYCGLFNYEFDTDVIVSPERFATEEEKAELFDVIKANGYKWNTETKTLEKLTPDKFDITTLVPFESRVLVRGDKSSYWKPAIFGCYIENIRIPCYALGGTCWHQCIPYEGNEHLLGTTDDCDEYFKTWK